MEVYTAIMLFLTTGFVLAGLLLYCGQTGWLRSLNWAAVKDKAAYARYLGKSVAALGIVTLLSGLAYRCAGTVPAVVVLVAGLVAAMAIIVKNASKHY